MDLDLTEDSFRDLEGTVSFWKDYAGQIREKLAYSQDYTDYPASAPIRGYLMQDVGAGESALIAQTLGVNKRNQFKMDMFGSLPVGTPFPFILRLYGVNNVNGSTTKTELFTTSIIGANDSATWIEVTNAIVATGTITEKDFSVAFGTPFTSTFLVPNTFMLRPDGINFAYNEGVDPAIYNPGVIPLVSQLNTWLLSFFKPDWDFNYAYLELTPYTPDGQTKYADYNNLIVVRPVFEIWTGIYQVVTDILHVSGPTPLKGGSRIVAVEFDDVGYGIITAYQRDFDVSPTGG